MQTTWQVIRKEVSPVKHKRPRVRDRTRINESIRADKIRLIGPEGEQLGIKSSKEALELAAESNLDLVEIAAGADPPVCRILDYGKYKYLQEQKAKQARKHQSTIVVKEIKLRPKIGDHDYMTKRSHVERFLRKKDKVKVTIMFRGREVVHPKKGEELLRRMAEDVAELGVIESEPNLDGRNMVMVLSPIR